MREAPSIPNIKRLLEEGAEIVAFDPVGEENFKKRFPDAKITYAKTAEDALKDAEAAFIFTEWEEITSVPLTEYKKQMKTPFILDGRNCYPLEEAEEAQVDYVSIGRKEIKA